MDFQRFETPGLAHYAYLVADGGEAAIVDPRRDVEDYLRAARALGVRIRWVVETHRQEDFVMGAAHLAARTGARIVNGKHDLFGHGDIRLEEGDTLQIGGLTLRALHTPGHTPESMSYALFPRESSKQAWGVFTGDALFFGDTGRTDLPDPDRSHENAAVLYDSVHEKIAPLGDATLVWPAHGPGSVCGRGMAHRPVSTVGAERQYNPIFGLTRDAFAQRKGAERIPRPPYFRFMEKVNLQGGIPPSTHPADVPLLSSDELAEASTQSTVIDTRKPEAFAGGHIPGTYAVLLGGLTSFGGWVAGHDTRILLVLDRDGDIDEAVMHLSRIGIDRVDGVLAGGFETWRRTGRPIETAGIITPRQLAEEYDGIQVLDVREPDEIARGHIATTRHLYVGHLEERLPELDLSRDSPTAVTCSVGNRASLGVSILLRHGFQDVRNLLGGMTAWNALGLPTRS